MKNRSSLHSIQVFVYKTRGHFALEFPFNDTIHWKEGHFFFTLKADP